MKLKENDAVPDSKVFIMEDGNPVQKNIQEFFKDKKIVLFGLPGAYTSVCSAKHLPGYIENYKKYKSKGIDLIVCISVNDPFVMDAWGKSHDADNKIVMMADPFLEFTKSIGADVDKSAKGLGIRSNRYTMLIDDLKVVKLQEEKDAGVCETSSAQNFLNLI